MGFVKQAAAFLLLVCYTQAPTNAQTEQQASVPPQKAPQLSTANISANSGPPLRLSRAPVQLNSVKFRQPPGGIAQRWLRNMRTPTFCPYLLCHGSCADIMGQFLIGGSCSSADAEAQPVPCGITKPILFSTPGSGCCSTAPGTIEECTTAGEECSGASCLAH